VRFVNMVCVQPEHCSCGVRAVYQLGVSSWCAGCFLALFEEMRPHVVGIRAKQLAALLEEERRNKS